MEFFFKVRPSDGYVDFCAFFNGTFNAISAIFVTLYKIKIVHQTQYFIFLNLAIRLNQKSYASTGGCPTKSF